ncbi:MAG TPA: fumarylacetoacetate hydrolase family protein [Gemmatimonadaceae bacterium]|jgi:2-keto-4-pentenoate hydratase/2-oxohepta-3-ene-1,7-dioic acid hydratase in catechol pathway|nr:fumarylacetoacetate hydrolase family protein [Gemmatimonadaceae bacterium]
MNRPSKIVCVGRNYVEHARELGNEVPTEPLIFLKPPSSVIPTGAFIERPPQSIQVEHEGEIGILIGKPLRRVSEEEAVSGIAGIVAVNDVTARDLQRKDSQWTRAKGFDTFCPVGNVHEGHVDLNALQLVTTVNDEVRQKASSAEMVFKIPMLLSFISHIMTLEPGDLVATGTPSGIGPLRAGDTVEVTIAGISRVRNPVRDVVQ